MTLSESFHAGGPFMWFVALCGIGVVISAVWKGFQLFTDGDLTRSERNKGMALIYQLGALGFVIGVASQVVGLMNALKAIREAADISLGIVVEGLRVSFISPLFGLIVLIISLIAWALLRYRADVLDAEEAAE